MQGKSRNYHKKGAFANAKAMVVYMNNSKNNAAEFAQLLCRSAERGLMKKAVFSKPNDKSITKMTLTLRRIGGNKVLQAEYLRADNKAIHKNFPFDSAVSDTIAMMCTEFGQVNLISACAQCEFKTSKSGNTVITGADNFRKSLDDPTEVPEEPMGNDRRKNHILNGSEPFLILLGVSNKNGRVLDRKRSKFNQINRFLEMIRDVLPYLPKDEITVCDLCCGKSYLSFAAYHYLSNIVGLRVDMTGADLKADVISFCGGVAAELGFDGLHFVCTDIGKLEPPGAPQLVISLHACDTATDVVLDRAADWGAKVILSTPCCHHELNHSLDCPELSFISDYSMIRQKFCDAATDALRLKKLEARGYSCEALELIDPDETPKNIMLRAIKKPDFRPDSAKAKKALEEYRRAKAFLLGKNTNTDFMKSGFENDLS
ncbi:MAG: class I SAM-dependent methyltransferase [Eubacteriales bacterium]